MGTILLGTEKSNGWKVDTDNQTITVYHLLNLVEKMHHAKQQEVISFQDIQLIVVGWNNVPAAWGDDNHYVIFKVVFNNNQFIEFEATSNIITKEQFKEAITLLLENQIQFKDDYHIIDTFMTSDLSSWEILNHAELEKRKREKTK